MKRLNSRNQEILFKILLNLRSKQSNEGGYIIVVVAGLIVAMSAMLLTGELVSRVDNNSTKSSSNSTAGFYAAEAGLNLRAKEIKTKFVGYNLPQGTSPVSSTDCSGGAGDFACNDNLKVQDYLYPNDSSKRISVRTYVVDQNVPYVNNLPNPKSSTLSTGVYAGLNAQEFIYDVTSVAFDRITGQPTASLGIRFKSQLIPIFQFAAFYGGTSPRQDLDYSIPPNMTMNGPIHSNGSIYLDAASNSTLQINGNLTMSKNLYRGERLTSSCSGTVKIYTSSLDCVGTGTSQYSQTTIDNTWKTKQIQTNMKDLASPPVSSFNSDSTGFYWNSAQLRVVLNLDANNNPVGIQVQTPSGGVDTAATNNLLGAACAPTSTTLQTAASSGTTALSVNPNSWSGVTPLQIEPAGTTNYDTNPLIDNDANVVNAPTSGSLTLSKQLGTAPLAGAVVRKATVWTSNTFWNYREKNVPGTPASNDAKQIRMLNVDVKALMTCANQIMGGKNINDTTNGGLVWYFTVKGPTAATNSSTYGIRLYNGAILASNNSADPVVKGLSIVSDQPIYVRGDYNCEWDERIKSGTTPYGCSTNPAYVSSPPPPPSGTTAPFKNPNAIYNKKPAAVMADSINILSNSWPLDDSYSVAYSGGIQPTTIPSGKTYSLPNPSVDWSTRTASDTTVNAAFLAGVDPSGGGLNNYPRFQETWSGKTLTYRGSMVSISEPQRVSGPFCGSGGTAGCNIYLPPFRNWDYDTDFNNAGLLPPLTPRVVNLQQERFTRDYSRTSFLPPSLPFASFLPVNMFSTLPNVMGGQFRF
jgi:hypothetical protein